MLKLFDTVMEPALAEPIDLAPRRFGMVTTCDGPIVEASGLALPVGALCTIAQGEARTYRGEVIGFRQGRTVMSLLGDAVMLRPGARVRPEGHAGLLNVGPKFLGRAVDALGQPIDGGGVVRAKAYWPAHGERSGALERGRVTTIFPTGIRAIDAVNTLGIGQRVGIMAGSGVGKSVLIDMIADGAQADVVVVGLIGERAREVSDFVGRHMTGDRAKKTAVIAVPADHAPNLRLRGAMLATSLAESFRAEGKRVLLILDSLTRVAHAAREIAFMLGESGAARGYPPSALATITKLVERAGNSVQSGGSITGIYTVLADGDDTNDPVVDTARSILDGHIVLSRDIAQRGRYPAIDVPASLSRVMADVTTPEHVEAGRVLRALIATLNANRDLVTMGAYKPGADPALDRALALESKIEAFLSQDRHQRANYETSLQELLGLVTSG